MKVKRCSIDFRQESSSNFNFSEDTTTLLLTGFDTSKHPFDGVSFKKINHLTLNMCKIHDPSFLKKFENLEGIALYSHIPFPEIPKDLVSIYIDSRENQRIDIDLREYKKLKKVFFFSNNRDSTILLPPVLDLLDIPLDVFLSLEVIPKIRTLRLERERTLINKPFYFDKSIVDKIPPLEQLILIKFRFKKIDFKKIREKCSRLRFLSCDFSSLTNKDVITTFDYCEVDGSISYRGIDLIPSKELGIMGRGNQYDTDDGFISKNIKINEKVINLYLSTYPLPPQKNIFGIRLYLPPNSKIEKIKTSLKFSINWIPPSLVLSQSFNLTERVIVKEEKIEKNRHPLIASNAILKKFRKITSNMKRILPFKVIELFLLEKFNVLKKQCTEDKFF